MVSKKQEGKMSREDYVNYIADVANTYPKETREVHQKVGELFHELKGHYPTVVLAAEFDMAARLIANDFINELIQFGGQGFGEQVLTEIKRNNTEQIIKIHNSR